MSDSTVGVRSSGDFERYGLVAALTLVVLSLLLAERMRSGAAAAAVPASDRLARVRIGGYDSTPRAVAPPTHAPPPVAQRTGASPPQPVAPEPRVVTPPAPAARTCVIAPGETLGDIALRELGTSRRAREIADLNGIADLHRIRAGQSLRLPPR